VFDDRAFLIETHSLPTLARRYRHGFTFYVAYPIRSIPTSQASASSFFLLNFYFLLFLVSIA
jgi:hypothetical protein